MTAAALAGELKLPLFTIRLDGLISRFMGETAAKLRLVFDAVAQTRAVYLFDEFDARVSQVDNPGSAGRVTGGPVRSRWSCRRGYSGRPSAGRVRRR
jgi:SpoVK/Ycf46/Vps4 family AAA+-type ATPase